MTLDQAQAIALERLQTHGHLLHSQLHQITGGDAELMREVRDSLIANGLAVDRYGVALVAVGDVALSAAVSPLIQASRNAGAEGESPPMSHAGPPLSQDDHRDQRDLGPNDFSDLRSIRPKSLWTVAAGERQPANVALTCPSTSQVDRASPSLGVEERTTTSRPIHMSSAAIDDTRHKPESHLAHLGAAVGANGDGTPDRIAPLLRQRPPSPASDGVTGGTLRYILWSGGHETGPFPREELELRIAEGRLQPTDFVRIDSEDEWIPASKALAQTGPSPVSASDRIPAVGTPTPAEEIAAATTLAVATTAAARRAARTHALPQSQPHTRPHSTRSSQSLPGLGAWPLPIQSGGTWLIQQCGKGRLQNGATILIVVLGLWTYWNWPPAAKTVSAEFQQYVLLLEGIEALHGPSTSSPDWRKFVERNQPRIKKLVESLKPRANGDHPADRELFYAGESGLLPMLREGLHGAARKKFTLHWQKAHQIFDGTEPANLAHAGSATSSGSPDSILANPATSSGSPSSSSNASSAIPPGVPTNAPYTPPGTPSVTPANPHDAPRPTR